MRSKDVREWARERERMKAKNVAKSNNVQHIFAIPFPLWLSIFVAHVCKRYTYSHFGAKMISWVCIFIKNFMFYILRLCNLVKSLSLVIPNGILCIVFLGIDVFSSSFLSSLCCARRIFDFVVWFACCIEMALKVALTDFSCVAFKLMHSKILAPLSSLCEKYGVLFTLVAIALLNVLCLGFGIQKNHFN